MQTFNQFLITSLIWEIENFRNFHQMYRKATSTLLAMKLQRPEMPEIAKARKASSTLLAFLSTPHSTHLDESNKNRPGSVSFQTVQIFAPVKTISMNQKVKI